MARSSKDIQLSELKDVILQLNTTIKTLNETITKLQAENDAQKAELAWFRQKLFGSSSERHAVPMEGQMSLPFLTENPEEEKPVELIEPEVVELPKKPRKAKTSIKEQFKDIPVRQVTVNTLTEEEKQCPLCGTEMVPIGTELIRSEIVYTPPKLERIEYMAVTYSCPDAIGQTTAKVSVVVGAKEQQAMIKSAEKLHKTIPGSILLVKEDLYHGEFSLNHPQEYAEYIRSLD